MLLRNYTGFYIHVYPAMNWVYTFRRVGLFGWLYKYIFKREIS
ncbi:hypothetical protein HNP55_001709 [Paucibacter oligotrophus]|uniref:Uncharacterized protein n=1 Tax=Roseateles oligotrophus TaxID=1769250 RepID=A0A840L4Q5_9BURK|nr:hypothetical protein [Roseateles oligotrophus]